MTPESNRPAPRPIYGFIAGTPLLMPDGLKPIEELRPGDFIQSGPDTEQPDDDQGGDEYDGPEPPRWWEEN